MFFDFLAIPLESRSYPTRFATGNNYAVIRVNKVNSQRSIRYQEPKLGNELPIETKTCARNNKTVFLKSVKEFLNLKQM